MKRAALSLVLCALVGCSGSAGKAPNTPTTRDDDRAGWFCQTAENAEAWECVQDSALAANPQPTRKPPKPAPPPPAPPRGPAFAPEPAPPAPEQEDASRHSDAIDTAPDETAAERPKHVRLSYKPDKPMSILELPEDFWAVQLVALSSPEALEEYVARHKMRGMSAARIWDGSKLFYVLLLGIYETREVAEEAITDLPPPFNLHAPWIRSLGSLQRAMVAADEAAGEAAPG